MALTAGRVFAINLLANSKPAEDAFKKVGQAAGRLPTPMKVAAAALTAVFAAVTTVAVKSFKALLDLGGEFNEVTRIIRVGTSAVGGDLAALEESFRSVARNVPSAFGDVAWVIAELDTRTELAGDGLEAMAEQLLTLSRLMGGDARTTTREVTRLFNRFGLEADEASRMLDLLFRASQASGAQIDTLAADVTKNAGALMEMGLSLEESVALFAIFEREGIRSQTVVRSLRSAFQRLTADGRPLRDALAEVFSELQTLDREAAVAKGLEIFGTQALDLVDAVRDGRLSVEDFTKQLVDGSDTIIGVAEETDGWRQALDTLRNNLKLMFEPAAREVFRNVTEFVESLIPAAQRVADAFEQDGLQGALEQVAVEWDKIYEEQIKPLFLRLLEWLNDTVRPLAIELGQAIGGAIASGIANAVRNSLRDRFFGQGESYFSDEERALLEGNMPSLPGLGRDLGMPAMGGAVDLSPAQPAPSRPSTSTNPAGSGTTARPSRPAFNPLAFDWDAERMATGGFVTGPTFAMVGEAGPEVVMPLDWFEDRYGAGRQNIVINVSGAIDSEGTARQILRVLRDAERRTGDRL
jgi:TP901 family phage tail tape measure protein